MVEDLIGSILISIGASICATSVYLYRTKKRSAPTPKQVRRSQDVRKLDELIEIINFVIEKEIIFRMKIELEIKKNTKIIQNFDNELSILTTNVVNALGDEVLNEMDYYFKRSYTLKFIMKSIQVFIIKYMQENKVTTTP